MSDDPRMPDNWKPGDPLLGLCFRGDCAKMTGRARPCPIHDELLQVAPAESEPTDPADTAFQVASSAPPTSADLLAVCDWVCQLALRVQNGELLPLVALLAVQFATERRERDRADARVDRAIANARRG